MIKNSDASKLNAYTFNNEVEWLTKKIDQRLDLFFENKNSDVRDVTPPEIKHDPSNYANFIKTYCTD